MVQSYLIAMGLSLLVITILNIYLGRSGIKKEIRWQHYLFGYLFILYLVIALKDVVGFPCISEWRRFLEMDRSIFNPNINIVPFSDGLEISAILNIVFFMPFGFLLPTLWEKYRRVIPTVIYGFIFSIIIEFGQLFTNGRGTDITDVIMNTLGTLIGWIIFMGLSKIFSKLVTKTIIKNNKMDNKILKNESFLYVIIPIICVFLS